MSSTNNKQMPGFTIVELLVVVPVALLVVATLVSIMLNLVGDALMSQQRNMAAYEMQDGLDQVEQDIRLSSSIMYTTGTVATPQGSNDSTAAFLADSGTLDTGSALILSAYATTTNPLLSTRVLVFTNQPTGSCAVPTSNDPLEYKIVYFVKANPNNGNALALWRRTIVPAPTLCSGTPWQKNSCFPTSTCVTEDRLVVNNVSSVTLTYYFETFNPYVVTTKTSLLATDNPTSVMFNVNTSKTVGTGVITSSMSTYASRLNN